MKKIFFVSALLILCFLFGTVINVNADTCNNNFDCRDQGVGWWCFKQAGQGAGECQPPDKGIGGGGNGVAANLPCNCTAAFGACGDKFGKTNIQWRQCTPAMNGTQTCNWRVLTTLYQYKTCSVTPTVTPVISGTPAPTENPNCKCNTSGACTTQCQFEKFTTGELPGVSYSNRIKCGLADVFKSTPTADQKTGWCQAEMRTKGDADGNGNAALKDYFYYVAAKFGAKIPPTVNPDFNGDDSINNEDRVIIIKSLTTNLPD